MKTKKKKALNIVTGPLGVGKTTAILHYLKNQAGKENIGVLVNDFGPLGLDGIFLQEQPQEAGSLRIESIPGGGLCCTRGAGFLAGQVTLIEWIFTNPADTSRLERDLLSCILNDDYELGNSHEQNHQTR